LGRPNTRHGGVLPVSLMWTLDCIADIIPRLVNGRNEFIKKLQEVMKHD